MIKISKIRDGAIGAMLDEYEKAINELILVIKDISMEQLIAIVDRETKDENCKSIQTILAHSVASGYKYAIEVRKWLGEEVQYKEKVLLNNTNKYALALQEMFRFNEELFKEYPTLKLCEYNPDNKINVRWGQQYDVEQLFEHAIVHILRHRRQIEKMLAQNNQK